MKDVATVKPAEQKGTWHVRDVVLGLVLLFVFWVLIAFAFMALELGENYLAVRGGELLGPLLVVLLLNTKYRLSPSLDVGLYRILKYGFAGAAGLVIINFPRDIWSGATTEFPVQYEAFIASGTLIRMFILSGLFLLGPILEECLYRGIFFRILRNRYDFFWGALVSSVLFAIPHGLQHQKLVQISIIGFVFAYVYEKSGSLVSSIITHSLVNICWFVFVYVGIQRLS
jgi:membrane protease YdiL (CAAX protease family)